MSHLIPSLNDAKRLGEKTGAGFYKVRRVSMCICINCSFYIYIAACYIGVGRTVGVVQARGGEDRRRILQVALSYCNWYVSIACAKLLEAAAT